MTADDQTFVLREKKEKKKKVSPHTPFIKNKKSKEESSLSLRQAAKIFDKSV